MSRRKCEISVPGSFEFQHEESWKLCAVRGSIPVLPHELAAYTQRCPYESNRVVKTNGLVEPDFEVLKALEQMVVDNPFLTIRVLDALVRSRRADRTLLMQEGIAEVLRRALDAGDAKVSQMVEGLVDHLTKLGFEAYRSLLEIHREIGRDVAAEAP